MKKLETESSVSQSESESSFTIKGLSKLKRHNRESFYLDENTSDYSEVDIVPETPPIPVRSRQEPLECNCKHEGEFMNVCDIHFKILNCIIVTSFIEKSHNHPGSNSS